MRAMVTAMLLWASGSAGALADTAAYVSQLFDHYAQSCGIAFTDPQGYVNSIPPQNAKGQANVVLSPDGLLVKAYHADAGFAAEVTFARHTEQLLATCIVMPMPDHPEFQRSIQIMSQQDGLSAYTETLASAVQSTIPSQKGITIIGGRTPMSNLYDYYGDQFSNELLVQSRHDFSFVLNAGDTKVPSIIAVEAGSVSIYSAHVIELGQ